MNGVVQNEFISVSFAAGKALVSRHLTHTPLVAAYGNSFRKWPVPVVDTFFGVPRVPPYASFHCIIYTVWPLLFL